MNIKILQTLIGKDVSMIVDGVYLHGAVTILEIIDDDTLKVASNLSNYGDSFIEIDKISEINVLKAAE